MNGFKLLGAVILCLFIDACSTVNSQPSSDSNIEKLRAFTVEDIDVALASATAHNDQLAAACYPVLKKYVEAGLLGGQDQVVGAVSAFQAARNLRHTVEQGIPVELRFYCSGLLMDERDFALRLAVVAGAAGASSGAIRLPILP